jgi:hypothetical protein
VPNLTAQERKPTTKARDHRRIRYKARFWPLYAMSYHKAKRASQSETNFRISLNRDDMMKLGFHDVNAYTYERRIWPTQLGGQLRGTRDSFLPTRALSFDDSVRSSLEVVRHSRPSSSYNRIGDQKMRRPLRGSTNCCENELWRSLNSFHFIRSDDYASQTRR